MRHRAVLAGVVAIVVAACGGAAMDEVGDAMRDAGELLNNAGDAMVDAGNAIAGSIAHAAGGEGGASGEAGGAGSSSGTGGGTASAEDALPNPRWVLRDKDGKAVQALVSGQTYKAGRARARFTDSVGDCVTIDRVGQRELGLSYSLATGKLDGCELSSNYPAWRGLGVAFATASCDGVAYGELGSFKEVAGTRYYADGPPTKITPYQWNGSACVAVSPAGGQDLWAFKPLPADVLNALPNPPYTLTVAY